VRGHARMRLASPTQAGYGTPTGSPGPFSARPLGHQLLAAISSHTFKNYETRERCSSDRRSDTLHRGRANHRTSNFYETANPSSYRFAARRSRTSGGRGAGDPIVGCRLRGGTDRVGVGRNRAGGRRCGTPRPWNSRRFAVATELSRRRSTPPPPDGDLLTKHHSVGREARTPRAAPSLDNPAPPADDSGRGSSPHLRSP
jgi:hypothetical protein